MSIQFNDLHIARALVPGLRQIAKILYLLTWWNKGRNADIGSYAKCCSNVLLSWFLQIRNGSFGPTS